MAGSAQSSPCRGMVLPSSDFPYLQAQVASQRPPPLPCPQDWVYGQVLLTSSHETSWRCPLLHIGLHCERRSAGLHHLGPDPSQSLLQIPRAIFLPTPGSLVNTAARVTLDNATWTRAALVPHLIKAFRCFRVETNQTGLLQEGPGKERPPQEGSSSRSVHGCPRRCPAAPLSSEPRCISRGGSGQQRPLPDPPGQRGEE